MTTRSHSTHAPTTNGRFHHDRSAVELEIELLAMAEGFFGSRILFALNKLGVFETLREGPQTIDRLAEGLGAKPAPLTRLLNAGVMLNLLCWEETTGYALNGHWERLLLSRSGDTYMGNWLNFLDYLSYVTSDLHRAAVEGGPLDDLLEAKKYHDVREFVLAMHNYAAVRGKELVHFLDTSTSSTLLDLGAGPGTYAFHLGLHNPDLTLYLLDLPEVLETAREVEATYPLKNDVHYLPVDITTEEIPGSYDLVLVSNTLHMLGEDESRRLLTRLHRHVNAGGSLVVQAQYMNEDRRGKRWPVLLDLIQLCITPHGRNHTVQETRAWLEDAGFTEIEYCAMTCYNTNGFLRAYKR